MRSSDLRRERENRRRADYREVILHAAERVILRKGFSAATMDDIAREVQLSKATIYKYVPGKGALLFEILSHYYDDLRLKMEAIASMPGTAGERLASAIHMALRESESKQSLTKVLWMDKSVLKLLRIFAAAAGKAGAASAADRKRLAQLLEKRRALNSVAERIFLDGAASGEFRPLDARRAVEFLEAVVEGYAHLRFWTSGHPAAADTADDLTRFIIDGIRNPERTEKEN